MFRPVIALESLEHRRLLASDLTASLSIAPTAVLPGNAVNISFTVSNLGTTTVTPTFNIDFFLSKDTTRGNADDIGGVSVPVTTDVPPGSFPISLQANVPIPSVLGAGQYFIGVFIDSTGAVAESNEGNNVSFTNLAALDVLTGTGILIVPGTSAAETIRLDKTAATTLSAKVGSAAARTYSTALVTGVIVQAGAGNDSVLVGNGVTSVVVYGDSGDDYLVDGDAPNTLNGGSGRDKIYGGPGNDRLTGGSSGDKIFGENGSDRIYGDDGNDLLDGGSHNDRIFGGNGIDTFYGQGGNDICYALDTVAEQVFGGSGTDSAQRDGTDVLSSIESTIV